MTLAGPHIILGLSPLCALPNQMRHSAPALETKVRVQRFVPPLKSRLDEMDLRRVLTSFPFAAACERIISQ